MNSCSRNPYFCELLRQCGNIFKKECHFLYSHVLSAFGSLHLHKRRNQDLSPIKSWGVSRLAFSWLKIPRISKYLLIDKFQVSHVTNQLKILSIKWLADQSQNRIKNPALWLDNKPDIYGRSVNFIDGVTSLIPCKDFSTYILT